MTNLKQILAVFLPCLLCLPGFTATVRAKPNIVILLADDLGYGELGCQGNAEIATPNIDSLARNGVRFTSGYVSGPVCSPSRAGLMTGRYQTRFGHELNAIGRANLDPKIGLPLRETTIASQLKSAGYATGIVGKWHLGATGKFLPQQRGFDEFYGFLHEGHFYVPPPWNGVTSFLRTDSLPAGSGERLASGKVIWSTHLRNSEPHYDEENPIRRGDDPIEEPAYLTDAIAREAVGFIERHRRAPFFLHVPFNAPHSPMQAADEYMKRFAHIDDIHRRVFAAMVANLDDAVGRILAKLSELRLDENTLVFFLSDNGGPTKELTSSNKPLSGGKGDLLEGGIRVPFIVQWKGHLPAGKTFAAPVIALDIFPTALAAAGADIPASLKLDGVNLLPFLRGETTGAPHSQLFWRYGPQGALRAGDWKLVKRGANDWRLFNLATDIAEQNNLAGQQSEKVRELKSAWTEWNAEQVAPLWGQPVAAKKK